MVEPAYSMTIAIMRLVTLEFMGYVNYQTLVYSI